MNPVDSEDKLSQVKVALTFTSVAEGGVEGDHCRIHSSCFDNCCVRKLQLAWKAYCADYRLKEHQESKDRCTGRYDPT